MESKEHYRIVHAGAKAWSKLAACAIIASQSIDRAERCVLLKLTRKPRPKVVAKTSITFLSNGRCMCCDQAQDEGTRLVADLRRRLHEAKGKSVRLTLEVIES